MDLLPLHQKNIHNIFHCNLALARIFVFVALSVRSIYRDITKREREIYPAGITFSMLRTLKRCIEPIVCVFKQSSRDERLENGEGKRKRYGRTKLAERNGG